MCDPISTDDHNERNSATEDILGQFCYALGQGAGNMRVHREVIAALRDRYEGPVNAAKHQWESDGPAVLQFVTQIGRLAALLATQGGRSAISAIDFTTARQLVESRAHKKVAGTIVAGPFCPPVAGELLHACEGSANHLGNPNLEQCGSVENSLGTGLPGIQLMITTSADWFAECSGRRPS